MIQGVVTATEVGEGTLSSTIEGQEDLQVVTLTVDAVMVGEGMETVRIQLALSSSVARQVANNLTRKSKQVLSPAEQLKGVGTLPTPEDQQETDTSA